MFPNQPPAASLETPGQAPLELTIAGIGSRCLALAVDTLIQAATAFVLFVILGSMGIGGALAGLRAHAAWLFAAFAALWLLLNFGYFVFFEMLWNGQTPGKRVVGIRAVKDSGRPLAPSEVIVRNLLRVVDQLPALYAVGIIVALANARNRRLGDFLAGSIVVREASLAALKPV